MAEEPTVPPPQEAFQPASIREEDEIDLRELAQAIWRGKWIVMLVTILALAGAVTYLNIAKYSYTVTLKVAPIDSKSSSLASKYGGLASLAGISLPSGGVDQFELYSELLTSLETAEKLAGRGDILRIVFAREWDEVGKKWIEPSGTLVDIKNKVKSTLGIPIYPWQPPAGERLKKFLEDEISTSKGRDGSITSISIDVTDPLFGMDLIWTLHENVDSELRARTLEKTERHIKYLSQQLSKVSIAEYRQALIETLSAQEKSRMMASSGLYFAAEPLGQPTTSLRPTKPKPTLVLALSLVLGAFLGIFTVIVRDWVRREG